LNYITPDHVHVMMGGRIVRSGGAELARELEDKGYEGIRGELDVDVDAAQDQPSADGQGPRP
jgi:Fe-S cluster assembly ATP-binding protein